MPSGALSSELDKVNFICSFIPHVKRKNRIAARIRAAIRQEETMYCVMRLEKRKATALSGLQKEARRELPEGHYNNKVRLQDSQGNIYLRDSSNWLMDTRKIIQAAGARERSNSVVGIDSVYAASPEWCREKSEEEITQYFRQCLTFHEEHYGRVISAIVHMDETSPHLHVMSVPLTQDGRLSARDLIGNREQMRQLQTEFYEQVGKQFGLQRGQERDSREKRDHINAQECRLHQNADRIQQQQYEYSKLQEEYKQLQRQNYTLKNKIKGNSEKLQSIQVQREKALRQKQHARAQEKVTLEQLEELQNFLSSAERKRIQELCEDILEESEER